MSVIVSNKIDGCLKVHTQWGVIKFKKLSDRPLFGQTVVCFLPKHGDYGCCCASCSVYSIVEEYKKKGYTAVEFSEYDNESQN